jgi:SIR2-like domain
MQFIQHGPDVPDQLLQAHEEGRVVFFCGAGISYPARLPGFAGLLDKLYANLAVTPSAIQNAAIKAGQFDTAVGLLEADIAGGRETVRRALADILRPDLSAPKAMRTHEALLTLSKTREGRIRLITTNFDRLFEEVATATSLSLERFKAPLLPVPKKRWDGLVYLHGLLSAAPTASELDRLVVSSGDFGLAYLTERWAARFVSELFRNYTVCFVGYSINDPVLRYMMDALAADRLLGESPPEMFAFGSYSKGKEEQLGNEWRAKNVTPILYREYKHHAYLHTTLQAWADIHRDGVLGKERIVVEYAYARPSASTRQDDFVGRMLWALSHESGLPAKRFSELNPVPPIEWLEAFSEDRFRYHDLCRFGVSPRSAVDEKLRFSLVRRPVHYGRTPWMALVLGGVSGGQLDDVLFQIARWIVRHLNDPVLILWLAKRGDRLHQTLIWMIESELDRFARLAKEGKSSELDDIRNNAPNAIPSPLMQKLWRLLISRRVKLPRQDSDLYGWKDRLKRDGLTTTLRFELRELLAPRVVLREPFNWPADESTDTPERIKQLVSWDLVLTANHVSSSLPDLNDEHWQKALPALLPDLELLLRDALDLARELGDADDQSDRSYWDLSSISPHWQNRDFRDWVVLIELLRDAWLATLQSDPQRAVQTAQAWFGMSYPTFKRLALFAASQNGCISSEQWVDWLLADDAWWLWSADTRRETMRLLVLQGANLSSEAKLQLETGILIGPPRRMYRDDIEAERWQLLVDGSVWLRLAKLKSSGCLLSHATTKKFAGLSAKYPELKLAEDERDEFSHWMSGTGDPDYETHQHTDVAPRRRKDLVIWLKKPPPEDRFFYRDNWREVCARHYVNAGSALADLAGEGCWPEERWSDAFSAWSEKNLPKRSWKCTAPLLNAMPDQTVQAIAHPLTRWMEAVAKSLETHEEIFFDLCKRVLARSHQVGVDTDRPVLQAINHPIGHVTQALLNLWFKRELNDNDTLPANLEPFFTQLCSTENDQFRHGRVLLASRLITLFRVDRSWTEEYLLPLFDWARSTNEAKAAWEGFLWSPRLYLPLLIAFKPQFLDTAQHYGELGEHSRQFAVFLTYAALDPPDSYSSTDFQAAIGNLPQEGLDEVASALYRALESAGKQREDYWRNRVHPFWHKIWPKSHKFASKSITESLARLSITAGIEFPLALADVINWLQPLEHPHSIIHALNEAGLCTRFPKDALRLLNAVIDEQSWVNSEFRRSLDAVLQASPEATQDPRYQRLDECARKRGV